MSEVRVDGVRAPSAASGEHELEVTPVRPLPEGADVTVVVRYRGVPSSKAACGFTSRHRTPDGGVAANEPEAARWWFPSDDPPLDKATYDVSVQEGTARELAGHVYASHPADDPLWTVEPGAPGPENRFHGAVHDRGAPALQAPRSPIGDEAFFAVLKGRPRKHAHGNATVADFRRYAEEVSGKPLAAPFDTWLYQASGPEGAAAGEAAVASGHARAAGEGPAAPPRSWKKIAATNGAHENAHRR